MKFKFKFKSTKSNLMNQETIPSICMHQQMIISTFYILGLSSKPFSTSFHWHFDSTTFNYMINIAYYLTNIHILILTQILFRLVNWLIMIVTWNSLNLVVLYRINKWGIWSRGGSKVGFIFSSSISFISMFFFCCLSLVILLMLITEQGINVLDIQTLMYFIICYIIVYLGIKSYNLLVLFNLIAILVDFGKIKLCLFPLTHQK
jgi:hypothetical protein